MTNAPLSLGNSLIVTVIGMLIVFFGLTVLIFLIKILIKLTDNLGKKTTKVAAVPAAPVPAQPVEEIVEEDDGELVAAIMAALSCVMEEGKTFTVRHIRRINNDNAWNRAGREEQIYSHG